jgi:hypothetical protein
MADALAVVAAPKVNFRRVSFMDFLRMHILGWAALRQPVIVAGAHHTPDRAQIPIAILIRGSTLRAEQICRGAAGAAAEL